MILRMRPLQIAALTAVALLALSTSAQAAVGNTNPTASCVDGNFFDGLDTRYAATYCASALNYAQYQAMRFSNTDSTGVLENLATDGIFYHAGHAFVSCQTSTYCTAVASALAGTSASSTTADSLLGDPNGVTLQGPGQECSTVCRSVTFVTTPYETEMQKFNLAIFQSCNSAQDGANGFSSLATVASNTGNVGTSIGFRNEVAWITNAPGDNIAGDAFARRFWSDLKNGSSYGAAVVDATSAAGGATYGYSSYVIHHQSGAPYYLSPAQYYIPSGV